MKKRMMILVCLIIGISFLITFFKEQTFNAMVFWDSMFIASLALTLLGACLYILNVGFFNAYTKQFKSFFKQISRTEQFISQVESKHSDAEPPFFEFTFATLFIVTGIISSLISGIISIILF